MACNCFNKVADACEKKITAEIGADLAEIADTGFDNSMWLLDGGDHAPVSLNYRFRYYRKRKNGQSESRQTRRDTAVMMSYCPFCGEPFTGSKKVEVSK